MQRAGSNTSNPNLSGRLRQHSKRTRQTPISSRCSPGGCQLLTVHMHQNPPPDCLATSISCPTEGRQAPAQRDLVSSPFFIQSHSCLPVPKADSPCLKLLEGFKLLKWLVPGGTGYQALSGKVKLSSLLHNSSLHPVLPCAFVSYLRLITQRKECF